MPTQENVSYKDVKNWLPIISGSLVVAAAFFAVQTQLAVLTEKVNQLADQQGTFITKAEDTSLRVSEKLGNHETRISLLESKKQSQAASSAQLSSRSLPETASADKLEVTSPERVSSQSAPIQQSQSVVVDRSTQEDSAGSPQPASSPSPTPSPSQTPIINFSLHTPLLERVLGGG